MNRIAFGGCVLAGAASLLVGARSAGPASVAVPKVVPQYDKSGALIRPKNFEHWTFVGANIGMSYSEGQSSGPGEFHNIYMQPESYEAYARTGTFPEKTMFLLVVHDPAQKVSINKSGYFEGPLTGLAVSVKDHEHFPEGWAYFDFGDASRFAESARPMAKSMCYECHKQHADDDNVFVQFHPMLRSAKEAREKAASSAR